MNKYFRLVAGTKLYCDEKGLLKKNADGNFDEVPETDTDAVEVTDSDDAVEEVEKMLKEATTKVKTDAEKSFGVSAKKASDAVNSMFEAITKSATQSKKVVEASQVKASYDVDAVKKGIEDLANKQRNTFSFSIKNLRELDFLTKTVSESENLTGDVIQPQVVPEVSRGPVRSIFMEQIADVTNMTSESLAYVEVTTESGAPLTTAELGQIPEKDFLFQEFKASLKKITVMNKHSVEILKDAPQLVSAIKGWLQEDVNIVTDEQLLKGNGSGENLQGVVGVATVLDATAVGTKRVPYANLFDVIRLALTKIAVAGKGKFSANYVLLNPADSDALDLTKDENGQYLLPPFRSADGTMIKGARVIENVGVTPGTFLVGDFRKLHVGVKGGVEIEMTNSDGDDFGKDILSVKLRRRITSYVRANDSGAFQTGTIATVINALTQS